MPAALGHCGLDDLLRGEQLAALRRKLPQGHRPVLAVPPGAGVRHDGDALVSQEQPERDQSHGAFERDAENDEPPHGQLSEQPVELRVCEGVAVLLGEDDLLKLPENLERDAQTVVGVYEGVIGKDAEGDLLLPVRAEHAIGSGQPAHVVGPTCVHARERGNPGPAGVGHQVFEVRQNLRRVECGARPLRGQIVPLRA